MDVDRTQQLACRGVRGWRMPRFPVSTEHGKESTMRTLKVIAIVGILVGLAAGVATWDRESSSVSAGPSNPDYIAPPSDWNAPPEVQYQELFDGSTLTNVQEALNYFDERYIRHRTRTHTITRLTTLISVDRMMGVGRIYGQYGMPAADLPVWVIAATIEGGVSQSDLGLGTSNEKLPGAYVVIAAGSGDPIVVGFLDPSGRLLSKIEALEDQTLNISRVPRLIPIEPGLPQEPTDR